MRGPRRPGSTSATATTAPGETDTARIAAEYAAMAERGGLSRGALRAKARRGDKAAADALRAAPRAAKGEA